MHEEVTGQTEEVCRKLKEAIGEYDELLILFKKWKLRWFDHVSSSSDLANSILQGTMGTVISDRKRMKR